MKITTIAVHDCKEQNFKYINQLRLRSERYIYGKLKEETDDTVKGFRPSLGFSCAECHPLKL